MLKYIWCLQELKNIYMSVYTETKDKIMFGKTNTIM